MGGRVKRRGRLQQMIDDGFDNSKLVNDRDDGRFYVRVGCSQCQAMCINGIPVHERGCPNEAVALRRQAEEEREEN